MEAPNDRLDNRPYITVTNELFRHPKFIRLTDKAKVHLLELWAYCNEYRTDGIIHKTLLMEKGQAVARALREVGWVDDTTDPDFFYMHDYLDHQKSRAQIEAYREQRRQDGKKGGIIGMHERWHVDRGVTNPDCPLCFPDHETG